MFSKKLIPALSLALLSLTQVSAKHIQVKAGPEAGLNFTDFWLKADGSKYKSTVTSGFKIGGVADFGFSQLFSFQPGIFFTQKGASTTLMNYDSVGALVSMKKKMRINYIEVPLNVLFKLGYGHEGHFEIGGGPYVSFAVGGKKSLTNTQFTVSGSTQETTSPLLIGDAATDDIKSIDWGFNLTGGYQWEAGVILRAQLGFGIQNILPEGNSDNHMRNWGFGVSAGYLFNCSKKH
ncbi:porin family protein [Taibaiella soli]|uniref:Outer membrane protein beta-barrel domain-containing protein n=1 Tax=Taibaiella soli TaxID=1649169 RepID=A0A2W2AHT5_9BACT|nr:porin family protein [Taibaiella soli]PZF73112.1 hypothetical protein DN068_09575 [Taibaiella soli]